ncbi:GNAT family N-acetyltransferase [Candidatus Bathyarchaeota archaeon]|nr:GNAT family N-acetyltransferase [Candidatus Bathyarchaeota archaeon]
MLEGPRAAKPEELIDVVNLVNSVFKIKPGSPSILMDLFPQLFNMDNLENLRVITYDGKLVSHVGIWEGELLIYGCWFKVGMIGSVCTHSNYRNRGYASALVRDAFSKMKRDGIDLVLVSGFRNLYRRVGCVEAGKVYTYNIPRGKLDLNLDDISIIHYSEDLLKDLIEIYHRESVRYRRSLEEFRILLRRGLQYEDLKIYTAINKGRPLAYIAIESFLNKNTPTIIEYAGPRSIILYLIEKLFKTLNINALKLTVPSHDLEMLYLLEKQNLEKISSEAPASMAIINPQSFLEKIQPYLEEKIGEKESRRFIHDLVHEKIRLYLNGEETSFLDSRALTLLFFGAPDKLRAPPQPEVKIKPHAESLSHALPLPTPVYGLNYI